VAIYDYDITVDIAGTKDISLVDVIGFPVFSIWFSYCNFRCPWCQNWPVVIGREVRRIKIMDLVDEIKNNSSFVDFVHVTGGEPTVQPEPLRVLFLAVKNELGLKNSLNTNGFNYEVIERLVREKLIDHVAMDVKAPLSKPELYAKVVGLNNGSEIVSRVTKSVKIVLDHIEFTEFRTTYIPLLNMDDLVLIAQELKELGCGDECYYIIQQFVPNQNAPNPEYRTGDILPVDKLIAIAKYVKRKTGLKKIYVRSLEEGLTPI